MNVEVQGGAYVVNIARVPGVTKDKDMAKSTAEAKEKDEAGLMVVSKMAGKANSVAVVRDEDKTQHLIVVSVVRVLLAYLLCWRGQVVAR